MSARAREVAKPDAAAVVVKSVLANLSGK